LQITVYDPIRDETLQWNVAPDTWGAWLIATNPTDPLRPPILVDSTAVRAYLTTQEMTLGADRRLDISEAVSAVQTTVAGGLANPRLRAYHRDRSHVVQPGETIISIAWDYGIPYPYVQEANGGIDSLSVGQTITIPSPDNMLRLPVIPNKRIVVSIPNQTVKVYENGALKWDWIASTGIDTSPTWTGVYQVLTHDPNAYASNWNLWMPDFLGVYYPVPGADFINGFHGFPTRGGSQLLWTGDLGTRVTYGCILVSSDNARLLYNWAEDGVIVEIQG
jgi:hypothetical protein